MVNWSKYPDDVKFIAREKNGSWTMFATRPQWHHNMKCWVIQSSSIDDSKPNACTVWHSIAPTEDVNYRSSLIERRFCSCGELEGSCNCDKQDHFNEDDFVVNHP